MSDEMACQRNSKIDPPVLILLKSNVRIQKKDIVQRKSYSK